MGVRDEIALGVGCRSPSAIRSVEEKHVYGEIRVRDAGGFMFTWDWIKINRQPFIRRYG